MPSQREKRAAGGRRDEIVAATRRVVAQDGVAGTTTRKIAAEAGLPLGAVHYWFRGKDEVLEALALEHVTRIGQAATTADADSEDAYEAARAALRAAMTSELEYPPGEQLALYELTTWALRDPERAPLAARHYTAIREATASACQPWLDRHGGTLAADSQTMAAMVSALFDGLALARLADPDGTPIDDVIDLFSRLIVAASVPPPSGGADD